MNIVFDIVDPNKIFGMVGRCGGGYNTMWEDWTPEGRAARESIMQEYETEMNKLCGHYEMLEKSILENGMQDPLIINCGSTARCKPHHLPPEIAKLPRVEQLLLEGTTGGSRLWIAQKHNIPVKCLINDFTNKYEGQKIRSAEHAKSYYNHPPAMLTVRSRRGLVEQFDQYKASPHLSSEWSEDKLLKHRAPLWIKIMNKHGYYVDRLPPVVQQVLRTAGVVQPESLKKRHRYE